MDFTAPAPAPAEKPNWECCVCYEDGKRTGQITLSCGHPLCLGCFVQHQNDQVRTGRPCPMCRRQIRLADGATPEEKDRLAQVARAVNRAKHDLERHQASAERARAEGRVATTRLADLMREIGLSDADLPGILAENPHVPPPARPAPAPAPAPARDALVNLQRTTPAPPRVDPGLVQHAFVAPAGETVRCAGCRTQKPAGSLRFYHMPGQNAGETRRLKRCEGCHTREWNAYRTRIRNQPPAPPGTYNPNADVPV